MTAYRCSYILPSDPPLITDQIVVGGGFGVAEGAFNDAEHGTTVEFNAETLPKPYTYYYDNAVIGAEALIPFPTHKLSISAPNPMIRGVQVDIRIIKVDAQGNPVGSGSEQLCLSTNRGILSNLTPSLVYGAVTIQYTPPNETIDIWLKAEDPTHILTEDGAARTLQNP